MRRRMMMRLVAWLLLVIFGGGGLNAREPTKDEALSSWNEGPSKRAILDFVTRVTQEGGPDYVAPADRIATFDHDGTLWAEQPMYFKIMFAMDRVRALAPKHPDWKTKQPFKAVLDRDIKALAALGETGFLRIIAVTHTETQRMILPRSSPTGLTPLATRALIASTPSSCTSRCWSC